MPLDKLIGRILSDARKEAEEAIGQASQESERIIENAESEAKAVREKILDDARSAALEEKRRIIAAARLKERQTILAVKQELIGEVIQEVGKEVGRISEDRYLQLLLGMLLDSAGGIEGEVVLSEKDRSRIGEKLVSLANEEIRKRGLGGELVLSDKTAEISKGFIVRSGGIEINNSLEALIAAKREELEQEIAETLFGS